jgi:glyoxylase-like metal-dependent hydrolase (beta-lactamase superfamily II)
VFGVLVGQVVVQLAPGVWRVPTVAMDLVNSFVLRDDDGQVTLVDAGLRNAPPRILAALAAIGSGPSDVTRILLTHAHGDHAGGASGLRAQTGAGVAVHADDAGFTRRGEGPPLDRTVLAGRLLRRGPAFRAVPVAEELHDGQVLDVGGGLRVVHTPGHTPGHVSLLHEPTRVLVTGDAIWNMWSRRTWPLLGLCWDAPLTQRTAAVLGDLDYDLVAFTHGPEIRSGAREAVRSFLARPRRFGSLARSRASAEGIG